MGSAAGGARPGATWCGEGLAASRPRPPPPARGSWAKAVPCPPGRPGCGEFWWAAVTGRPCLPRAAGRAGSADMRGPEAQGSPWGFQGDALGKAASVWASGPGADCGCRFPGRGSRDSFPAGGGWTLHSAAEEEGTMGTALLCLPKDGVLGSGWLWWMVAVPRGPFDQGWNPLEPL